MVKIAGLMEGKTALISGVANKYSIAWATAELLYKQGAQLVFTYQGEKVKDRVAKLVESLSPKLLIDCDVTKDEDLKNLGETVMKEAGKIDFFLHSIAFADKADLKGDFIDTSRDGFALAQDISAYSLAAMCQALLPALKAAGESSVAYMTYIGAEKAIPNYNVMGVAKASLEATGRYLARDLGKDGIRINGISAGPIKTLAAKGIGDFSLLQKMAEDMQLIKGILTAEDIAGTALYLASDLSKSMTGEVLHVDKGFHTS